MRRLCPLLVGFVLGTHVVAVSMAMAADALTVKVFPFTGEVQFLNEFDSPADFVFYSITSASSSLHRDDGVWLSIADTYDVSGNGFIDEVNEWVEFAPDPMDPGKQLAEGVSQGTGSLLAVRGISLGKVLTPGVYASDLTFVVQKADQTPLTLDIQDAIAGDYDENRRVDIQDYVVWKTFFGSPIFVELADGNLNGTLDAGDYTIWRDNLGKELPNAGEGQVAGGVLALQTAGVPEPTGMLLAVGMGGSLCCWRRRRRRAG